MDSRSRKALSWSVSFVVHATLLFFVGRAALNYALPEGEVNSDPTTIDVVSGPQGKQTDFKPVEPKEAPTDKTVPAAKAVAASPKVHVFKGRQAKGAGDDEPPVKFLPDKDFNEIKAAPPEDETEDISKHDQPKELEPEAIPEKTKEAMNEDEAVEKTENVPQELPKKEQVAQAAPPPPAAQEEATAPAANEVPPVAGSVQQTDAHGNAVAAAPPAYGTPGTSLDLSKLSERAGNPKPNYPFVARFRHQEGLVIVRAYIRPDGRVDLPILEKSSGYPLLDTEALKAFAHWRFEPNQGGWALKPFQFNLKK